MILTLPFASAVPSSVSFERMPRSVLNASTTRLASFWREPIASWSPSAHGISVYLRLALPLRLPLSTINALARVGLEAGGIPGTLFEPFQSVLLQFGHGAHAPLQGKHDLESWSARIEPEANDPDNR